MMYIIIVLLYIYNEILLLFIRESVEFYCSILNVVFDFYSRQMKTVRVEMMKMT